MIVSFYTYIGIHEEALVYNHDFFVVFLISRISICSIESDSGKTWRLSSRKYFKGGCRETFKMGKFYLVLAFLTCQI